MNKEIKKSKMKYKIPNKTVLQNNMQFNSKVKIKKDMI
jgi:hypothetical protein